MAKKKKRRAYVMRSKAEKRAILRKYDRAEKGEKIDILGQEGLCYSHIWAWRSQLGMPSKRAKKKARKVRRARA